MNDFNFYIASCVRDGGVYKYHFSDGKAELTEKIPLDMPMYIAKEGDILHVILNDPYADNRQSGYVKIENGTPGDIIPTHGLVACHLCADDGQIYCVNYMSGNVVKLPDTDDMHTGNSIHPTRQTEPHTHYVCLSPEGKYILAVDLGTDTIYTYTKELELVSTATVPSGSGCRHLEYRNGYYYCANELTSDVSVFAYDDGRLTLLDTYPGLPSDFKEKNTMAAIRTDGDYLYVSNRGHNSIVSYKINGSKLELIDFFPCGGNSPRDFNIYGNILICTNEKSNNVTFFEIKDGRLYPLEEELQIPAPLCVIFE